MMEGTDDAERRFWGKVSCAPSGSTTDAGAPRQRFEQPKTLNAHCSWSAPAGVALYEDIDFISG